MHPLQLSNVRVTLTLDEGSNAVNVECEVGCEGRTGVEMEALTGAAVAALTVYDMCKAVTHDITIEHVQGWSTRAAARVATTTETVMTDIG